MDLLHALKAHLNSSPSTAELSAWLASYPARQVHAAVRHALAGDDAALVDALWPAVCASDECLEVCGDGGCPSLTLLAAKFGRTARLARVLEDKPESVEDVWPREEREEEREREEEEEEEEEEVCEEAGREEARGVDVGRNALHLASEGGHYACVQLLLDHADKVRAGCGRVRGRGRGGVNARDARGCTPLHLACARGHEEVVGLLLRHRASLGVTDAGGRTPLDVAGSAAVVTAALKHHSSEQMARFDSASVQPSVTPFEQIPVGDLGALFVHGMGVGYDQRIFNKLGVYPFDRLSAEERLFVLAEISEVLARPASSPRPAYFNTPIFESALFAAFVCIDARVQDEIRDWELFVGEDLVPPESGGADAQSHGSSMAGTVFGTARSQADLEATAHYKQGQMPPAYHEAVAKFPGPGEAGRIYELHRWRQRVLDAYQQRFFTDLCSVGVSVQTSNPVVWQELVSSLCRSFFGITYAVKARAFTCPHDEVRKRIWARLLASNDVPPTFLDFDLLDLRVMMPEMRYSFALYGNNARRYVQARGGVPSLPVCACGRCMSAPGLDVPVSIKLLVAREHIEWARETDGAKRGPHANNNVAALCNGFYAGNGWSAAEIDKARSVQAPKGDDEAPTDEASAALQVLLSTPRGQPSGGKYDAQAIRQRLRALGPRRVYQAFASSVFAKDKGYGCKMAKAGHLRFRALGLTAPPAAQDFDTAHVAILAQHEKAPEPSPMVPPSHLLLSDGTLQDTSKKQPSQQQQQGSTDADAPIPGQVYALHRMVANGFGEQGDKTGVPDLPGLVPLCLFSAEAMGSRVLEAVVREYGDELGAFVRGLPVERLEEFATVPLAKFQHLLACYPHWERLRTALDELRREEKPALLAELEAAGALVELRQHEEAVKPSVALGEALRGGAPEVVGAFVESVLEAGARSFSERVWIRGMRTSVGGSDDKVNDVYEGKHKWKASMDGTVRKGHELVDPRAKVGEAGDIWPRAPSQRELLTDEDFFLLLYLGKADGHARYQTRPCLFEQRFDARRSQRLSKRLGIEWNRLQQDGGGEDDEVEVEEMRLDHRLFGADELGDVGLPPRLQSLLQPDEWLCFGRKQLEQVWLREVCAAFAVDFLVRREEERAAKARRQLEAELAQEEERERKKKEKKKAKQKAKQKEKPAEVQQDQDQEQPGVAPKKEEPKAKHDAEPAKVKAKKKQQKQSGVVEEVAAAVAAAVVDPELEQKRKVVIENPFEVLDPETVRLRKQQEEAERERKRKLEEAERQRQRKLEQERARAKAEEERRERKRQQEEKREKRRLEREQKRKEREQKKKDALEAAKVAKAAAMKKAEEEAIAAAAKAAAESAAAAEAEGAPSLGQDAAPGSDRWMDKYRDGMVFIANKQTFPEAMHRQLLGLPRQHLKAVRSLRPETSAIFVFNASTRQLHGLLEPSSRGGDNLVPDAFKRNKRAGGSPYPAQVRFKVVRNYIPLRESEFSRVLKDAQQRVRKMDNGMVRRLIRIFEARSRRAMQSQEGEQGEATDAAADEGGVDVKKQQVEKKKKKEKESPKKKDKVVAKKKDKHKDVPKSPEKVVVKQKPSSPVAAAPAPAPAPHENPWVQRSRQQEMKRAQEEEQRRRMAQYQQQQQQQRAPYVPMGEMTPPQSPSIPSGRISPGPGFDYAPGGTSPGGFAGASGAPSLEQVDVQALIQQAQMQLQQGAMQLQQGGQGQAAQAQQQLDHLQKLQQLQQLIQLQQMQLQQQATQLQQQQQQQQPPPPQPQPQPQYAAPAQTWQQPTAPVAQQSSVYGWNNGAQFSSAASASAASPSAAWPSASASVSSPVSSMQQSLGLNPAAAQWTPQQQYHHQQQQQQPQHVHQQHQPQHHVPTPAWPAPQQQPQPTQPSLAPLGRSLSAGSNPAVDLWASPAASSYPVSSPTASSAAPASSSAASSEADAIMASVWASVQQGSEPSPAAAPASSPPGPLSGGFSSNAPSLGAGAFSSSLGLGLGGPASGGGGGGGGIWGSSPLRSVSAGTVPSSASGASPAVGAGLGVRGSPASVLSHASSDPSNAAEHLLSNPADLPPGLSFLADWHDTHDRHN